MCIRDRSKLVQTCPNLFKLDATWRKYPKYWKKKITRLGSPGVEKTKVFCDKTLRISFFPAGPKVRLVKKNEIFSTPGDPLNRGKKSDFFSSTLVRSPKSDPFQPFPASSTYFYLLGSHSGLEKRNFWCKQHCWSSKIGKVTAISLFSSSSSIDILLD